MRPCPPFVPRIVFYGETQASEQTNERTSKQTNEQTPLRSLARQTKEIKNEISSSKTTMTTHGKPTEGMCCFCNMEDITEEDGNYGA
mmetsp:Transcript_111332/g.227996  ORF Transcript_111332/g.227996 Transcript_111332/m.227996 type:complete len:87 (+) Transcript_111332:25-285(+)